MKITHYCNVQKFNKQFWRTNVQQKKSIIEPCFIWYSIILICTFGSWIFLHLFCTISSILLVRNGCNGLKLSIDSFPGSNTTPGLFLIRLKHTVHALGGQCCTISGGSLWMFVSLGQTGARLLVPGQNFDCDFGSCSCIVPYRVMKLDLKWHFCSS